MSFGNVEENPTRSFSPLLVVAFSGTTYVSVDPLDVPPLMFVPETVSPEESIILTFTFPEFGTNW
jgi:hypothetical protein